MEIHSKRDRGAWEFRQKLEAKLEKDMYETTRVLVAGELLSQRGEEIFALDPGGTTGWSNMIFRDGTAADIRKRGMSAALEGLVYWSHGEIDCTAARSPYEDTYRTGDRYFGEHLGGDEVLERIFKRPNAAVVVESFDLREFSKSEDLLSPVRLINSIGKDLWRENRTMWLQAPAMKPQMNDERLKMWGFYDRVGGLGHARDADRHALIFLGRCAKDARLRALAFGV